MAKDCTTWPNEDFSLICISHETNLGKDFGVSNDVLHCAEMKMLQWSLGITLLDHVENTEVRRKLGVRPIVDKVSSGRLRWYGHVLRSDVTSVAHSALLLRAPGTRPRGRPRKRWFDNIAADLRERGLTAEDAADRAAWRRQINSADPVCIWD